MTKPLKEQKLLESKAAAYDSIVRLRASVDSHRNFHRLVSHIIAGVQDFAKQLDLAPTTQSEQFPCQCRDPKCNHCNGVCKSESSCQATNLEGDTILLCDLCANSALHRGIVSIVEESCSELEHD